MTKSQRQFEKEVLEPQLADFWQWLNDNNPNGYKHEISPSNRVISVPMLQIQCPIIELLELFGGSKQDKENALTAKAFIKELNNVQSIKAAA